MIYLKTNIVHIFVNKINNLQINLFLPFASICAKKKIRIIKIDVHKMK